MATPENEDKRQAGKDDTQQATDSSAVGFRGLIEGQYRKIKENAETYPYVWGSYIVVYGTLGLWFTYRWRKLRKTEDRIRVLQERLRKVVEAENIAEAEKSSSSTIKSADNSPGKLP